MNKILKIFMLTFITSLSLAEAKSVASEIYVPVTKISFNDNSGQIHIFGYLPNGCAASPRPTLLVSENANELILAVSASQSNSICMTVMNGEYDLAFDVASLKANIEDLGLDSNTTYTLVSADRLFKAEVNFSQMEFTKPYSTFTKVGKIQTLQNGQVNISSSSGTIELRIPSDVNISVYENENVEIQGHLVKTRTPALPFAIDQSVEKIILTGINLTAK